MVFFKLYKKIVTGSNKKYHWNNFHDSDMPLHSDYAFDSYEEGYHQLMYELVQLQILNIRRAMGNQKIKRLFIDGGFANNTIFIELLSLGMENIKIKTTNASLGSALGSAIVISNATLSSEFLVDNYNLKKHRPLITN